MRGAFLHVVGDLLQSLGVLIVGAIVWAKPSLHILDPLLTFVFSAIVLATTARLLRDIVDVVMERSPRTIDPSDVAALLGRLPGVVGVHDLHIWALMPGKTILTVHITASAERGAAEVLAQVQRAIAALRIQHATIQVEV